MEQTFTKDEILAFLQQQLKTEVNLSSFCRKHSLNYQVISAIKNGRKKKNYPKIMVELCDIFGYNLKSNLFYILEKKDNKKVIKDGKYAKPKDKTKTRKPKPNSGRNLRSKTLRTR